MDALDELYGVPPDQFIDTRDALAKKLKAAGDKDGAAAVKKAHKPTLAAWALNQVPRVAKAELEALLEAGKALASGRDFKASLERQRDALEAVRKKVPGDDAYAVMQVVQGALVDAQLAEAVKLGRFAKLPEAPVGFFGAAPEGAPPVVVPPKPPKRPTPPPPPPPLPKPSPPKPKRDLQKLEAELRHAEEELAEAKRRLWAAEAKVQELKAKREGA